MEEFMSAESSKKGLLETEDWWAVWIGLFIFILGMTPLLTGGKVDLLGWVIKPSVWLDFGKSMGPFKKGALNSIVSLLLTYVAYTAVLTVGAKFLGLNIKKFVIGFTVVYFVTFLCYLIGHHAFIAADSLGAAKKAVLSANPGLKSDPGALKSAAEGAMKLMLSADAGLIIALFVGLFIGNFMPKFAEYLSEAARPEWFIKTAIVVLGIGVGLKAAGSLSLSFNIIFRGLCAIIEAYLIYWAVVYYIARKWFKFSKEWAAPLASGISICGVSAAIATGGAIRARPIVPIMVSSLVVVFAVVELIVLPFAAKAFLSHEPLVAAAWMGLAVKTDGAAVASGQLTASLLLGSDAAQGKGWSEQLIILTTTNIKVFIDIFIGVWAAILAIIWSTKIDTEKSGQKFSGSEIWDRFPKFVLGYIFTFALMLIVGFALTGKEAETVATLKAAKMGAKETDLFRKMFFALTFFSIGVVSNFKKLWEEGIGRLAIVYIIGLFGFIIWVALLISWLFFAGVYPK